jgi:hypothetical protein
VTSSVSGLLCDSAHVRQARSRCLRCCPRVTVIALSRPPYRARGGHEPLRPELAALLGVCPLSQLTQVWVVGLLPVSLLDSAKCSAWARRPSAFQAGRIPYWRGSCERLCAAAGRCCPPMAAAVAVTVAVSPRVSGLGRSCSSAITAARLDSPPCFVVANAQGQVLPCPRLL